MSTTTIGPFPKLYMAVFFILAIPLQACDLLTPLTSKVGTEQSIETEFTTVEWTELMPAADLEALLNPPDYIMEVAEGSEDDLIAGLLKSNQPVKEEDRYQQALTSTAIRPELNGANIRIPGYIVPLDFTENQSVTDFFLVPYFGACIHVPPPPPNQIILIKSDEGVEINDLFAPYWVSGELLTELQENDLALSAYSMNLQQLELYTGP